MNTMPIDSDNRRITRGFVRWLLLTGDRLLVSFIILLGIGAVFVSAGVTRLVTVTTATRVMWYLNGTVNGLLTLIPIAIGVNQIVLSQELGSIQEYHQHRKDITEFREGVEQRIKTTATSPSASAFFSTLIGGIADTGRTLHQDYHNSSMDEQVREEIQRVTRSIWIEAEEANEKLTPGETSMFKTLLILLSYDTSYNFHKVRELDRKLSSSDTDIAAGLQEIEDLYIQTDAAREYLKTLVVEQQLARLSMLLIYTGIPAVCVAALGIFIYRDIPGLTLSHSTLVLVAASFIVLTLVPLAILAAYVLRIATIAKRTAAFGPFIPESKR